MPPPHFQPQAQLVVYLCLARKYFPSAFHAFLDVLLHLLNALCKVVGVLAHQRQHILNIQFGEHFLLEGLNALGNQVQPNGLKGRSLHLGGFVKSGMGVGVDLGPTICKVFWFGLLPSQPESKSWLSEMYLSSI